MFNFGILSTSLPYLVLAITSLLYFASFSLNQLQNRSQEELITEAKVIEHTVRTAKPDNTYFYQQASRSCKNQIQVPISNSTSLIAKFHFEFSGDPPSFINPNWLKCHITLPPPAYC